MSAPSKAASIPATTISAGTVLQHVSRKEFENQNLFFGKNGLNRYDCPQKSYGVLYIAFDLETAIMESVFHKHSWSTRAQRSVSVAKVEDRMVRTVGVHRDLLLADLMQPNVVTALLGLNLSQISSRRYGHTQRLSSAIHAVVDEDEFKFDGLIYPSRNNFPEKCVALFEHASAKVSVAKDIDLAMHADWPGFVNQFQISIVP